MKKMIVLVVLLSGCATQKAEWDLDRFGTYCEKIGFKRETEAFASCIQQQAASHRVMPQRTRTNCVQVGNTMSCN